MLNDEEKKALYMISLRRKGIPPNGGFIADNEEITIILNLIEKQSKEIEELKDKIKAKIEEIDNMELCSMRIPKLSTLDERLGAKIGIKYVLQSLLEKE